MINEENMIEERCPFCPEKKKSLFLTKCQCGVITCISHRHKDHHCILRDKENIEKNLREKLPQLTSNHNYTPI